MRQNLAMLCTLLAKIFSFHRVGRKLLLLWRQRTWLFRPWICLSFIFTRQLSKWPVGVSISFNCWVFFQLPLLVSYYSQKLLQPILTLFLRLRCSRLESAGPIVLIRRFAARASAAQLPVGESTAEAIYGRLSLLRGAIEARYLIIDEGT